MCDCCKIYNMLSTCVCVSQCKKNHTHYIQVGCLYYITSHTLFQSEESASLNNCPIKVGLLVISCMKEVSDTPGTSLPCKSSESDSDSWVLVFGVIGVSCVGITSLGCSLLRIPPSQSGTYTTLSPRVLPVLHREQ